MERGSRLVNGGWWLVVGGWNVGILCLFGIQRQAAGKIVHN
jgi:hypothetical protein